MRPRLTSTTVGLAVGITAFERRGGFVTVQTLLNTVRRNARSQAELIRGALEHAMLENDRTLIERMITTFGREPRVVNVMLLDRDGVVRFTSGPVAAGDELSIVSATCQACHKDPPAARMSSRVIDTAGGSVLRTVVPIRNHVDCHQCHDPGHTINGVLISDLDTAEIQAAARRDQVRVRTTDETVSPVKVYLPARGPLWFRKMDLNGDGDVSRREWLGTRELFDRMDADKDGLLGVEEAEAYDRATRR